MSITPTPHIDFLSVFPGCTKITGYVGSFDSIGNYIPDADSYVYIYLDGILVDEKHNTTDPEGEVFPVGTEKAVSDIILNERYGVYVTTAKDGTWSWFVPMGYNIIVGQRIVVTAQTAGKDMSEYSAEEIVGATPVPINIVSLNSDGSNGIIKAGDQTIEGMLDGWISLDIGNTILPYVPDSTNPLERQDLTIFVYVNGIQDGSVTNNTIYTNKDVLDLFSFKEGGTLPLYVQGELATFNIPNLGKNTYEEYFSVSVPIQTRFSLTKYTQLEFSDIIPVVSKNGLRLAEFVDYTITPTALILINGQYAKAGDDVLVTFNAIDSVSNYVQQVFAGVAGMQTFILAPNVSGNSIEDKYINLKVYKNGKRLKYPTTYSSSVPNYTDINNIVDYTLEVFGDTTALVLQEITAEKDVVVIEYIKEGVDETGYSIDNYSIYTNQTVFSFDSSNIPGLSYINVFCNGRRLREKIMDNTGDYTIQPVAPTSSTFNINILTPLNDGDLITIEYVFYSNVNAILDVINKDQTFIQYRITASNRDGKLVLASPFTLEPVYNDVSYNALLNGGTTLYPGKNAAGQFYSFFNPVSGQWRYTFSQPLNRMQYVNAATRAFIFEVA